MDDQQRKLQALWRKALLDGELIIPCGSRSNATRLRFALYAAVRKERSGKVACDDELKTAVESISIGFSPEDNTSLLLQPRSETELMRVVDGVLGETPSTLLANAEERTILASQERLRENLQPAQQTGTTPYYTREE